MSSERVGSRVVVTGGTGLIGGALAAALAADRREVVVLTRKPPSEVSLPDGCRAVRWDGRTSAGWLGECDGADAIVNLAGESIAGWRWTAAKKRRIVASRLDAAAAVLEAIERSDRRPPLLVQASAVGFYGDRGDEPLAESSAPGTGFLAATTIEWERATERVEALGVRRILLRTGLVLSKTGGALATIARPFRFGLGGRIGSGRQWMPWIHLADEAAAIRVLLDEPAASGPYNLSAPAPVTQAEFARELGRALRRPTFVATPAGVIRVVLGEMAGLVLGGQRAVPERLLAAGFRYRFADLESALTELFVPPAGES